jgi:iron complex outermembrane receptor protein
MRGAFAGLRGVLLVSLLLAGAPAPQPALAGPTGPDQRARTGEAARRGTSGAATEVSPVPHTLDDLLTMGAPIPGLRRRQREAGNSNVVTASVEQLERVVVVSAAFQSQTIHEAPAIISTISGAEMRRRGYRSVSEVLDSLPGFDVLRDHALPNVGVRGINAGLRGGSRVLKVMIDGRPVAFRPSTENWLGPELIPVEVIDRIEVIRGPGSALYGADAFLGVVSIITKSVDQIDGAALTGSVGSFGTQPWFGGSTALGYKLGPVGLVLSAQIERVDRSGLSPVEVPGRDIYDETARAEKAVAMPVSALASARWQEARFGTLKADVQYQRFDNRSEFSDWAILTHDNRIGLHALYLSAGLERPLGERFQLETAAGYSYMGPTGSERLGLSLVGLADYVTRDVSTSGLDGSTRLRFALGQLNSVTVGADVQANHHVLQTFYRHFEGREQEMMESPPERTFVNSGVFAQLMLLPFDWLRASAWDLNLTLGGRFEHHSIYGSTPNARVNLVLQTPYAVYLKLLFGTSFKAPSAVQLFSRPIAPGDVSGNPELKPERARTLESQIGYRWGSASIIATTFLSNVSNAIYLTRRPESQTSVATNAGEIVSVGAELEVSGAWRGIQMWANASWQQSDETRRDPFRGTIEAPTRLFPQWLAKGGVRAPLPLASAYLYGEGRYVGARYSSEQNAGVYDPINRSSYQLPAYLVLDAAFGCELPLLPRAPSSLVLRVSNVLDAEHAYPGFRDFDVPGDPRTLMLLLSQRLE